MKEFRLLILLSIFLCTAAAFGSSFTITDVTATSDGGFYALVEYVDVPLFLFTTKRPPPAKFRRQIVIRLDKNFQLVKSFGNEGMVKILFDETFTNIAASPMGQVALSRSYFRSSHDHDLRNRSLEDQLDRAFILGGKQGEEEHLRKLINPKGVAGIGVLYLDGKSPVVNAEGTYYEHNLLEGVLNEIGFFIAQTAINQTGGLDLVYGSSPNEGPPITYVVRLKPNGQLQQFGEDGKVQILKPLQGTWGPIVYEGNLLQFSHAENTETGNFYQAIQVAEDGKQKLVAERKDLDNGYPISIHYDARTKQFLAGEANDFGYAGTLRVLPADRARPSLDFFTNIIEQFVPTTDGTILTRAERGMFNEMDGFGLEQNSRLIIGQEDIKVQKVPGLLSCEKTLRRLLITSTNK